MELKQYTDNQFKELEMLIECLKGEHEDQMEKWGLQTHSMFEWCNYLTEEVGELAKAIAEHEYRKGDSKDIINEAIQVATLALKIAEMVM